MDKEQQIYFHFSTIQDTNFFRTKRKKIDTDMHVTSN